MGFQVMRVAPDVAGSDLSAGRTFALLGSSSFEPWAEEVYTHTLSRSRAGDGTVLIVPTALYAEGVDAFSQEVARGSRYFEAMGIRAHAAPICVRGDAFREELVVLTNSPSFIFFSGGHPEYLVRVFRDTPFWTEVRAALERGVALGGCSAGMWMLGELVPDSTATNLSEHRYVPGLRAIPNVVLAPHWNSLDTLIPGLQGHVAGHVPRGCILIAVDDRTAVVGDGETWRVFGDGSVHTQPTYEGPSFRAGDVFTTRSDVD